ncbi:MAG: phosphotransferase [Mariprofundales bacterium]|nr:phosphotransferase [Mariprofundales bacterium]
MTDTRNQCIAHWVDRVLGQGVLLTPLAGDASFRRYLRAQRGEGTGSERWVVMDAPPAKESVVPFLQVRRWLESLDLRVPALVAADEAVGLLLLEDFGDTTWAQARDQGRAVAPLFADAVRQLHLLQAGDASALHSPCFDHARMARECALYLDWYLPFVAQREVDARFRANFFAALEPLFEQIARIPQAPVHLDYHSRNLMLPDDAVPLGVIDFQDACLGPITYDLSSLIYDCYQDYGLTQPLAVSEGFYHALPARFHSAFADAEAWHQALLATSLQRHIKVCGIFARLAFRDGKTQFLQALPQTRRHLLFELDALEMTDALRAPLAFE